MDEIQAYFSTGELTSRALIKCYLQRIADFDNPVTFKGEVRGRSQLCIFSAFLLEKLPALAPKNLCEVHCRSVVLPKNVFTSEKVLLTVGRSLLTIWRRATLASIGCPGTLEKRMVTYMESFTNFDYLLGSSTL